MKARGKKRKYWGLLLLLMLFAAGFTTHAAAKEVQAAADGFRTVNGTTYYYKDGKMQKTGLTKINGKSRAGDGTRRTVTVTSTRAPASWRAAGW